MHPTFFLPRERISLDNWQQADPFTKQLFDWLPDLRFQLGNTHCFFCLVWPPDHWIDQTPAGADTYILHFGGEYVNWGWVARFCDRFCDSKVILISPYTTSLYARSNLQLITINFWPTILKNIIEEHPVPAVNYTGKTKKISALANRVGQFKAYVAAHLHKTWDPDDYIISWRNYHGKPEDLYLLNYTGNAKIDTVIDYVKNVLMKTTIAPDGDFINAPADNLFYNWKAYTDCVVNCSNESLPNSYQQTDTGFHIVPGPFLTEKTWKCLLAGTALVPVGQYQTYQYLETMGFKFEYPWDCSFDSITGDIDRIDRLLDCLDSINQYTAQELASLTESSNRHNRDHILSGDCYRRVSKTNQANIDTFIANI
jgi:hypothetical protein